MNRLLSTTELLALWGDNRPARLVFTNGCFDLLHPGHLRYLADARRLGDCLVVGLNDDDSVRRLKGATRPLLNLAVRGELLTGLRMVDYAVPFKEDTPLATILALRPDVLVKGGDYGRDEIVGAREVEGWGGSVEVIPLSVGFSATAMALNIHQAMDYELRGEEPNHYRPFDGSPDPEVEQLKAERDAAIKQAAKRKL